MKSFLNEGIADIAAVNRSLAAHGELLDTSDIAPRTFGTFTFHGPYGEGPLAAHNRSLALLGEQVDEDSFEDDSEDHLAPWNRSLAVLGEEVDDNSFAPRVATRRVKPRVNRGAVNRVLRLFGERV